MKNVQFQCGTVEKKIETRLQGGMFRSNEIPLHDDSTASRNEWNHFNLYNLFDDRILIFASFYQKHSVTNKHYCLIYGTVNIL